MKTETFSGTIENAYGKPLPEPVKFNGTFEAFQSIDEVRSKNEYPKDTEIVNFVNARAKANARQKAMQAALDAAGIEKPTLENDKSLQYKTMLKTLVASGKSEAEADAIARSLGFAPEE